MEVKINNHSSRILLERTDNGIILYEVNDENDVTSKIAYEIYFRNGILNFESMITFFQDAIDILKIPTEEPETNRKIVMMITKIDPEKPALGEENEGEE